MVLKEVRRYVRELSLNPVTQGDVEKASMAIAGAIDLFGEREGLQGIRADTDRKGRKVIRLDFSQHNPAKQLFKIISHNPAVSGNVAFGLFPDEPRAAMRTVVIAPENWAGKLLVARLKDELEIHPRWVVAKKPVKLR